MQFTMLMPLFSIILLTNAAAVHKHHKNITSTHHSLHKHYHSTIPTSSLTPTVTTIIASQVQRREPDTRPTPEPTGDPSVATTVHITSIHDFSLLTPGRQGELVSDAESDGVSFCTPGAAEQHCKNRPRFVDGFVIAADMQESDDGSWIQITGCMNPSLTTMDSKDAGGQMDVRFPNGAQCTFGGYGASFIELLEPALNRFCIRCCRDANDQQNCNSHQDRLGCETAIPGKYDFPELGVSCA